MRIGLGRRRRPLPAATAQELELPAGTRVLAWSTLVGGGAAAATVEGLRILTPRGKLIARPWVEVDHAAWEQASQTLAVWWVGSRVTTPLEIEDDEGLFPQVVRERVQSSLVASVSVPVGAGRTARVALRKAVDGTLTVQQLLPPGVRPDAPEVAPALARAAARLRNDAGLD